MNSRFLLLLKVVGLLLFVAIPLIGSVPYLLGVCTAGAYARVSKQLPYSTGPVANEIRRSLELFEQVPPGLQINFHRDLYCWVMEAPLSDELAQRNPMERLKKIARFPNALGLGLPARSAQILLNQTEKIQ